MNAQHLTDDELLAELERRGRTPKCRRWHEREARRAANLAIRWAIVAIAGSCIAIGSQIIAAVMR